MLIQMHWQHQDGLIEFKAQLEVEGSSHNELSDKAKKVNKLHPLPPFCIWLYCTEESKYFIGGKAC